MKLTNTLVSTQDDSVNFEFQGDFPGMFEARYVRRTPDYFVAYLSVQSGCAQGCRMCHLTTTKQTKYINASIEQVLHQAQQVLEYYSLNCYQADLVHFNFMARGEPLNSPVITLTGRELFEALARLADKYGLFPQFLVSTIMPRSFQNTKLEDIFSPNAPIPDIYYSLYSTDPDFRKKWLPNAMLVNQALDILLEYQKKYLKIPKIHWAFIKDENDDEKTIRDICHTFYYRKRLRADINIVRYNPYSPEYGEESSEEVVQHNIDILRAMLPFSNIQEVRRVGYDVKASCGMFLDSNV